MAVTIEDRPDDDRYEARVDGDLAGILTYHRHGRRIALVHTEVPQAWEGQGIAKELAVHALDAARRDGLEVIPSCPYVAEYVRRHPDRYADLVPESRRAEFGL
ncbi:GNAT family N-acetyltransferase [Nocardioides taihuensis]|uniref:GNAT family N-acetyltransferase n=1 Tax=Nocardioides taihuensis TaxID=1835606 RepID=A0ABW0BGV0_9ACTN